MNKQDTYEEYKIWVVESMKSKNLSLIAGILINGLAVARSRENEELAIPLSLHRMLTQEEWEIYPETKH